MKIKTLLTVFIAVFAILSLTAQETQEDLFKKLEKAEWKEVKQAKESLENFQGDIIPELIKLCKDDRVVKLENTGSLIYPGAEKFFGYGQIIEYDIDRISVRAGWLLEDMTFNNFGFSGVHYPMDQLETFIKVTFPEFYNNSGNRKKIQNSKEDELRQLIIDLSREAAAKWWADSKNTWTRLDALYDALKSYDEKRQVKALFYIRNGKSACPGLDKQVWVKKLYGEVVRLSDSDVQRISEHASFILLDIKFDWLELKAQEQ
ncbi:MAG: hypothetical protein MI922_21910 [Bacteroidales bacterium]|nr:hypothetical protein [Bacteroidales bacterium]